MLIFPDYIMKKKVRIIAFFFFICFLPFLRSCGDVSMGFPAAAFSGKCIFVIESVNMTALCLNIAAAVLISAVAILISRRFSAGYLSASGIKGVIIYHALILAGYMVTHPLYTVFTNSIMEYAAGIHLYILYPFHELLPFQPLDRLSADSGIYGDVLDLRLRIHYMIMVLIWFAAGCLTAYIRMRKVKAGGAKEADH